MGSPKGKLKEIERDEISLALGECNWIVSMAVKKISITEAMTDYRSREYEI